MKSTILNRALRALVSSGSAARLALALVASSALFSACDIHSTTAPGSLATITVTPNVTLPINTTQQFIAVGRDAVGELVAISPVWTIEGGGGAIDGVGMFTAGTVPGVYTATVKATAGTISGTANVTVVVGPLATITVTPNPDTTVVTTTQQFTAVGADAGGNIIPITPVWAVAAGGGTISTAGLFTAGTVPGSYLNTITAFSGTTTGTATVVVIAGPLASITVTPNPDTLAINVQRQFVAVGRDASNNVVPVTPTWSVVASGGVISATGMFTAGTTPGSFVNTVSAASGAISGTATVVVTLGPLATITVTPNPDTLAINGTRQFVAVGRDAGNNIVVISPTWSVVASGGAVDGTGLFTAGTTPGTFLNTVRAAVGAINGNATVTVTVGPLATIAVTPNPDTLAINATRQFVAVGRDAGNNIVVISPTWSVVASGGAVDGTGLFTAGTTPGSFVNTVRAAVGAINGNATVVVTAGPIATIVVSPNPDTLDVSTTSQFSAVARDVANNVVAFTPVWSVVAGGGTIGVNGLFTAGNAGGTFTNTVQASSGAINGNATVVVIDPLLIDFGVAAPNGIMAGTAITCITAGLISADILISPGNTVTGFGGPCVQTGTQDLATANGVAAQLKLTAAYDSLRAIPCTTPIVADLGGTTVGPGVYCTAIGIGVTGVLTLDGGGDPNAKFVFNAGSSLVTAGDVVLQNGAQAKNVYWVVGSSATLGTASQWQGNIVALTDITLVDAATLIGRALARNGAVTLGSGNTITLP